MQAASCIPPKTFLAFSRDLVKHRLPHAHKTERVPDFTDTQRISTRTLKLFGAGFAGAIAGRILLSSFFPKKLTETLGKNLRERFELKGIEEQARRENWISLNDTSSLVGMAFEYPEARQTLASYLAASIIGYIGGSFLQGTQETWVRREETKIRARLISRLNEAFTTSIRTKNLFDASLKLQAKDRLASLLKQNGISDAEKYLNEMAVVESLKTSQHYFFEPTHRTLSTGAGVRFGDGEGDGESNDIIPPHWKTAVDTAALGAGAVTGLALMGLVNVIRKPLASVGVKKPADATLIKTINARDLEGLFLLKDKRILGVFALITAAAKVGKLFIDGLREIEITQANAGTEYRYQHHNWTVLDPGFHRIAEEEALDNDLKKLGDDLPGLKQNPALLQQRVQTILANIGRNSAPKYFPMTPPVSLVDARS